MKKRKISLRLHSFFLYSLPEWHTCAVTKASPPAAPLSSCSRRWLWPCQIGEASAEDSHVICDEIFSVGCSSIALQEPCSCKASHCSTLPAPRVLRCLSEPFSRESLAAGECFKLSPWGHPWANQGFHLKSLRPLPCKTGWYVAEWVGNAKWAHGGRGGQRWRPQARQRPRQHRPLGRLAPDVADGRRQRHVAAPSLDLRGAPPDLLHAVALCRETPREPRGLQGVTLRGLGLDVMEALEQQRCPNRHYTD